MYSVSISPNTVPVCLYLLVTYPFCFYLVAFVFVCGTEIWRKAHSQHAWMHPVDILQTHSLYPPQTCLHIHWIMEMYNTGLVNAFVCNLKSIPFACSSCEIEKNIAAELYAKKSVLCRNFEHAFVEWYWQCSNNLHVQQSHTRRAGSCHSKSLSYVCLYMILAILSVFG